ncbi:MAG: hypothetical protein Q8936_10785 [Bacillota bacterium]|nr:hypothetical protein [Bacillota bacterium]
MSDELSRELIAAKENLLKKQKLENLVTETKKSLKQETSRKKKLGKILKAEDKDVKRLESVSISSIFHSLLGNKEKQIEKEKEELLSAKLNYEECCKLVSTLEKELKTHEDSLVNLVGAEEKYETAFKRKKEFILKLSNGNSQKLHQLMDKATYLKTQQKYLKEAISDGKSSQNALERVLRPLEKAEKVGSWDILTGETAAEEDNERHYLVNEARKHSHYARTSLKWFRDKLSNVNLTIDIDIHITPLETLLEELLSDVDEDWVDELTEQSRIRESLHRVQRVAKNVDNLIDSMTKTLNNIGNKIISTDNEIKLFVEQINLE